MPTASPTDRPARRQNKVTSLFLHEDERLKLFKLMGDAGEREITEFVVKSLRLDSVSSPRPSEGAAAEAGA